MKVCARMVPARQDVSAELTCTSAKDDRHRISVALREGGGQETPLDTYGTFGDFDAVPFVVSLYCARLLRGWGTAVGRVTADG
jgi:hypothetical protein